MALQRWGFENLGMRVALTESVRLYFIYFSFAIPPSGGHTQLPFFEMLLFRFLQRKTACLHRLGQHRYGRPSSTPDEVRACQILNVTALWDVEDGGEDSDGIESEDEEEEDDVFQIIEAVECAGNHRAGDEEGDFWV
ncbi:hypothetical protein K438DRAFT_1769863 [Mycena galopus ATCC 62051]|nr:hypothetical protein K438DRAFT_1769863 [Mycena galopus ATCC 62051]